MNCDFFLLQEAKRKGRTQQEMETRKRKQTSHVGRQLPWHLLVTNGPAQEEHHGEEPGVIRRSAQLCKEIGTLVPLSLIKECDEVPHASQGSATA